MVSMNKQCDVSPSLQLCSRRRFSWDHTSNGAKINHAPSGGRSEGEGFPVNFSFVCLASNRVEYTL